MDQMEWITGILMGTGLAAACGLRVFAPLLVVSVAGLSGWLPMGVGLDWLATWPAVLILATATLLEVGAFYIPWLDNALDVLAAPAAAAAGTLVMATAVTDVDPLLRWSLAIIAGGGIAGGVHGLSASLRGASSIATAGFGNPVVATVENAGSLLLALLAIVVPLVAGLLVVGLVGAALRMLLTRRRGRALVTGPSSAVRPAAMEEDST